MFAPGVKKDKKLWVFISDLCRSIWLEYDEETDVSGIDAFRFRPGLDVFDMGMSENFCYCPHFLECAAIKDDEYDRKPCEAFGCMDGLIQVAGCLKAPIAMSAPHFYNSDKSLLDAVSGLKPDRDLHDTILDVEPISGLSLNAHKRIQVCFDAAPSVDGITNYFVRFR